MAPADVPRIGPAATPNTFTVLSEIASSAAISSFARAHRVGIDGTRRLEARPLDNIHRQLNKR
jgi:hypothetical protein